MNYIGVQIWMASTSGSFPGIEEIARTAGQAVRDAFYVRFPGSWNILYEGVDLNAPKATSGSEQIITPVPVTSGLFDPSKVQPWYVERKPEVPELFYYHTPQDSSYYAKVATTWVMPVLERCDYPDNKLLVYNHNGVTIWIRPDQVRTSGSVKA